MTNTAPTYSTFYGTDRTRTTRVGQTTLSPDTFTARCFKQGWHSLRMVREQDTVAEIGVSEDGRRTWWAESDA